jgi:peptide/nickel transport system substrate-binding protein
MIRASRLPIFLALSVALAASTIPGHHARAQERPRYGGELVFMVPSEPPSYDGHREGTFGTIHPLAPMYNTLLRIDPTDRTGTRPVSDLAESWTISPDGLTYTFKLRSGVRFHDGSLLSSRDVKASYDKIVFPPAGVISARKGAYQAVEAIEAPDPLTVRFRLKWPEASFLVNLSSPFNWIYKADILAKDMRWYETNVMGTGPFKFVEHVKGSHWVAKKNPDYWDKGKPYLDGYRIVFISASAAQVSAIRGERAHAQFRGFTPSERDSLVQALGPKIAVQESPWDCLSLVAMNHERKPFDDKRVRRALTLALDRYEASKNLSRIAVVREVAGIQVPGTAWATPPQELEKLAGYGRDIQKSRAEARRLLREAGVPDGFSFTFKNRGIPMPYETVGIWLIDQWRQIGLNVKQEVVEAATMVSVLRRGDFDVASDAQCSFVVEPDIDVQKFQSVGVSDNNYGHYKDPVLDDLFMKQSRAVDPEERKRYVRAFEKRLLDEEVHYLYTLQWHRIVAYNAKVRGWTITPSHFLNQQLDGVWLAVLGFLLCAGGRPARRPRPARPAWPTRYPDARGPRVRSPFPRSPFHVPRPRRSARCDRPPARDAPPRWWRG